MSTIELTICGRPYQVRCRDGEEANLQAAGRLVDEKSREVLSGLGALSEARQFFFAALLMADQMINGGDKAASSMTPPPAANPLDEAHLEAAEALAERLEAIANSLENPGASA